MKKTSYLHISFLLAIICCLSSCQDEDFFAPMESDVLEGFSLEEAKNYFQEMAEQQFSRNAETDDNLPLSPGDIVPQWESAVPSAKNGLACYDIPFSETYFYQAVYSEERTGTITAEKVKVYQKLIVVKDIKSEKLSQYILSLIPQKTYESQNGQQILDRFITRGDKGGFTGIAVYSCLYTWQTARVDTYRNGKRVQGVFLLDAKNNAEFWEKAEKAKAQISMLSLQKGKRLLSRGEDDYTYDGGWMDEVIVTPDEPDDTDDSYYDPWEEWLESSRPDSNVDPQPEPEPELPDEDYSTPDNEPEEPNTPNMSGFNGDEQAKVQNAVNKVIQQTPDINFKNINVVKGSGSSGNAGINNEGQIILYDRFFNILAESDRPPVLYHEIYHLQHGHNKVSTETKAVEEKMNEPPAELKQIMIEDLRKDFPYADENLIKDFYQYGLSVNSIRCPEFYENELETYKTEKAFFPDSTISESYKEDRIKAEWTYQEKLEIANKYYK